MRERRTRTCQASLALVRYLYKDDMTVAEEPIAPRNVFVSFIPASETKIVRFKGSTFGELKGRLTEAKVPGYSPSSFVELQLGEGQFVCLLDNEELPSGELVVTIQQSGKYSYASTALLLASGPALLLAREEAECMASFTQSASKAQQKCWQQRCRLPALYVAL